MRRAAFALLFFAAFAGMTEAALAHRVNVFAYVDGGEIQVECRFSRSQKVRNGKLVITDAETGAVLLEAVTDEEGRFRFRPPDAFLNAGHGLNIRLDAGEGHRDDWKISAKELRALSADAGPSVGAEAGPPSRREAAVGAAAKPATPAAAVDAAELEAVIGRVIDEKLAPIRRALAEQREDGPGLRDVVGGIGWILGLLGLAAYMKYRR